MRERDAKACDSIAGNTADFPRDHRRAAGQCSSQIRALSATFTDAELLAAAMQLPEVRALVEAASKMAEGIIVECNFQNDHSQSYFSRYMNMRAALAPFTKGGE
jgi:hypothetical protein